MTWEVELESAQIKDGIDKAEAEVAKREAALAKQEAELAQLEAEVTAKELEKAKENIRNADDCADYQKRQWRSELSSASISEFHKMRSEQAATQLERRMILSQRNARLARQQAAIAEKAAELAQRKAALLQKTDFWRFSDYV